MTKKVKPFYHPANILLYIAIGLLWLLAKLPYSLLLIIGKYLGRLMLLNKKATRTAEINLKLCFEDLSDNDRKELLKKNCEAMGISLIETGLAWWGNEKKLAPLIHVHEMQHLERALSKGKGVIFCSAHFLSLELAGRLLITQKPFAVIYRPQKNPLFDTIAKHNRSKIYERIIARSDLRGMLKYLKGNGIVWYTPDIDAGVKNSIFVPFFGIICATITATVRLAELSGAAIVPVFPYRREDGTGYDVHIYPSLEGFPSGNLEQDTLQINQIIEQAVRQCPEQYLWQYKRFKTRPAGETRFYD